MFGSALSLVTGILIGLSALPLSSGYNANPSLAYDALFHPDIMIFGVLGGLLITEKLESMEKFMVLKLFRISRPTIFFLFSGIAVVSIGYLYANLFLVDTGLILVMFAALLFLYFLTSKRGHSLISIRWIFGASAASIAFSAFANTTSPIWMNVQLTYLALLFPIIYIMAERVELGFVRGMNRRTIALQAALSWSIVISGFVAAEYPHYPFRNFAMGSSILLLLFMILSTVNFDPSFRKSQRKGKFQVYMRTGVAVAYFWLFLGLALFTIQLTTSEDILDAATHSIALGFIGTFIVAHSPIIFPMTLKRNAVQDNVTFLPLVVITIATAMRIFGDLGSGMNAIWNIVSYLSGYVLIIAILAFVYNLKRITVPSGTMVSTERIQQN